MENVVNNLKRLNWRDLGVGLVILHGSILWKGKPGDVDLVVFAVGGLSEDEVAIRVMERVEEAVGIEADVYVVSDVINVNCFLLLEAVRHGVIIYQEPEGRQMLVKAINVCNDFMISRRKVGYTETLVRRVLK